MKKNLDKTKEIVINEEFFKEQLKQCLYTKQLMITENEFWHQFIDHSLIAISFLGIGIFIGIFMVYFVFQHKAKIDYDMPRGTILRVKHQDRKWLIVRPRNLTQLLDIMLLCYISCGKKHDKTIDRHSARRVRLIRKILFVVLFMFIVIGIYEILTAFAWSINPFKYY